eukprot:UN07752
MLLNDKKNNIIHLWEFDDDGIPQWAEDAERNGTRKETMPCEAPDDELITTFKRRKRKNGKLQTIVASDDPSFMKKRYK